MDRIIEFFEKEFGAYLVFGLLVVGIFILYKVFRKVNKTIEGEGETAMSNRQMSAANKAVQKLQEAVALLKESDENLEQALTLRDEVLGADLPTAKVYIKAEDPRSLLLDLNKRIEGAKSRGYVKEEGYYDGKKKRHGDEDGEMM